MINLQHRQALEPLQPIEIDLAVNIIQKKLSGVLPWCTHVYGRSYRIEEATENMRLVVPQVYVGKIDNKYFMLPVTLDNDKHTTVFFAISKERPYKFEPNTTNLLQYSVGVIFSANLALIDPVLAANEDFTQLLIKQVRDVFTNGFVGDPFKIQIEEITRDPAEVYREFRLNDNKIGQPPFSVFRVNLTVSFTEECGAPFTLPPIEPIPPYKPKLSQFENDTDFQNGMQVDGKIAEALEGIPSVDPSQFATAAQGEKADTALQPGDIDTTQFATAAQGIKADSAVQPGDLPNFSDFATAQQGAKADTAIQPNILAAELTTKADLVNGKVPLSQINDTLLGNVHFKGLYNGIVITNSGAENGQPLPSAASGNEGWYFICTQDFVNGLIDYKVGDWILSIGNAWAKVDNTDAVSSVAGKTGNVTLYSADIVGLTAILADKQNVISGSGFALWNGTGITWITGTGGQLLTGAGTLISTSMFATAAQGIKADSAVQPDHLLNYPLIILADFPDTEVTGFTTEQTFKTYKIPANTLSNGILSVAISYEFIGAAGTASMRVTKNNSAIATGLLQIWVTPRASATTLSVERAGDFVINNNVLRGFPAGSPTSGYNQTSSLAQSTTSFNTGEDIYIRLHCTLSNTADKGILRMVKILFFKQKTL